MVMKIDKVNLIIIFIDDWRCKENAQELGSES